MHSTNIVEKTYKVIRRVFLSIILLFYPKVTKKNGLHTTSRLFSLIDDKTFNILYICYFYAWIIDILYPDKSLCSPMFSIFTYG